MKIRKIDAGANAGAAIAQLQRKLQTENEEALKSVKAIMASVRKYGDAALFEYTQRFDGVKIDADSLIVPKSDMEKAINGCDPSFIETLRLSAANIRAYCERQKMDGFMAENDGATIGMIITPVARVGIYVPGGKAAYPSSVLMNAIPAKVAGVLEIYMATPPDADGNIAPSILAAAEIAGVDAVYKMGGAQAVAAFSYGTESVPKVDKITGPGNIYVALAKREAFGSAGIDMIAGPSEILIIADETANPAFIAADMLSQAEHDELATAILITTSPTLAEAAQSELESQLALLPRKDIAQASLESTGAIITVQTLQDAVGIANEIAPEHLELAVAEPEKLLPLVKNAGAVFLGQYTPEPLGDYFAGPNHILPTSGTARFFSPLGVYDFVKRTSVIGYTKEAFKHAAAHVSAFARYEGLEAHARAIDIRLEEDNK